MKGCKNWERKASGGTLSLWRTTIGKLRIDWVSIEFILSNKSGNAICHTRRNCKTCINTYNEYYRRICINHAARREGRGGINFLIILRFPVFGRGRAGWFPEVFRRSSLYHHYIITIRTLSADSGDIGEIQGSSRGKTRTIPRHPPAESSFSCEKS